MRFFRADAATYESVRFHLDAAWGHGPGTGTLTCYEPEAAAPHDADGRVLLAVNDDFCRYDAVAAVLPQLLANGAVEEITEDEYRSSIPQESPP